MTDYITKNCSKAKVEGFIQAGDLKIIEIIDEWQAAKDGNAKIIGDYQGEPIKWVPIECLSALQKGTRGHKKGELQEAKEASESAIGKAIGRASEHTLGFLIPSHLKIISKQEKIYEETKDVCRTNNNLKKKLEEKLEILGAIDPEELKDSLRAIKSVENTVKLLADKNDCRAQLEKANAEIARLQTIIGELRDEISEISEGQNQKSGARKNVKNGPKKNNQGQSAQGQPQPSTSFADMAANNTQAPMSNVSPATTNQGGDQEGYQTQNKPRLGRAKKRNDATNQGNNQVHPPKKGKPSPKELEEACKIILHGVEVPVGGKEDDDPVLIQEAMDEFRPVYIGGKGLNIDVSKEIHNIMRIKGHWDEKPVDEGGRNAPPIEFTFRHIERARKFKAAAAYAGALNGRRKMKYGKYQIPKYVNKAGEKITPSAEEINRAERRPTFFFRGSVDKETRKRHYEEKQKRKDPDEIRKRQEFINKRKEFYKDRIILGDNPSIDTTRIDEIVRKRNQEDEEHAKLKAEKKEADRLKKEQERAEEAKKEAEALQKTNTAIAESVENKELKESLNADAKTQAAQSEDSATNSSFGSTTSNQEETLASQS